MPLLIGAAHQAEVMLEDVMALQAQKLLGELPLAALEDLDHRDGRVIVADPPRNAAEEFKGLAMPLQERLGAFPWEHLDEDRDRIRQRHHEQRHLLRLARYRHGGFAKIDLSLARRVRQRQEHFPPRLLPL